MSCSESSGSSDPGPDIPAEDSPLSGTWVGYFLAGDDDIYDPNDTSAITYDSDDIFVIGIITLEREARFISDKSMFVCPEGEFTVVDVDAVRKLFGGDLLYYVWDTFGADGSDDYVATVSNKTIYGDAFLTNYFLQGLYWDAGTEDTYWPFEVYNYNTTGVLPDIEELDGEWVMQNAFKKGNTLTFTIAKTSESTASIRGEDSTPFGTKNTFDGTITIHYDEENPNNVIFDLYLCMNDLIDLNGLATYIESMDFAGIDPIERTLAIGVTDTTTHLLTGFAKSVPE